MWMLSTTFSLAIAVFFDALWTMSEGHSMRKILLFLFLFFEFIKKILIYLCSDLPTFLSDSLCIHFGPVFRRRIHIPVDTGRKLNVHKTFRSNGIEENTQNVKTQLLQLNLNQFWVNRHIKIKRQVHFIIKKYFL